VAVVKKLLVEVRLLKMLKLRPMEVAVGEGFVVIR
jgi:hypothetical protein